MAAPAENLLSPGHRTGTKENTFTKQRERSRVTELQQRLQELKDRERQAQRHNNQLLQQFEKAQDTLKEMLARNAAMKTIRMEYERYLEENSPRWRQQLQEKTQAAQKKSMDDCLRSYLEKTDEKEVLASTVDGPLLSHGSSSRPQKCVAPQENSDCNQNSSSHHPFTQSSWLTSTQNHTGRFPGYLTAPHQSQSPCLFLPPNLLHPHSFLLQHLTSSPGQYQPWSGQDAAGWDSSQHNDPGSRAAAGSLGQLHAALRDSQTVREEDETRTPPNSNKKDGGSRSLSPDLDVKPVRLFSSHAESSESGRDSSLVCMKKKKKKRGRTQNSSSDSERSDSQRSPRTSSKIASFPPAQSSERNSSSEENSRRTKRGGGLSVRTAQPEEGEKEETRSEEDKESQHNDEEDGSSSEKLENQSHGEESKSCGAEEPGINLINQTKEETDIQEGSSSEQSCMEEKDEEDILETGDEENSQKSEKQISDLEEDDDDEVSTRKKTSEEEEEETEDQGDEEQLNLKNKDTEIRKEDSATSQDEDGSEGSEDETDEGSNKEEDSSEEEEESGDSEDIIVSPQDKRSKQMLVIPEEAAEDDDDESKSQSSNEFSDEDIENLLAPLEQTEQKDAKADEEPKAVCHNMNIVQVTEVKSKAGHQSDSDEFDHFYD